MSTTFRWLVPILLVMVFVFFVAYRGLVQNTATATTAEVEVLNEIVGTGNVRGEFDEREKKLHFDKDEVVTNLIAHIATLQKTHGFDLEIDYAFLDENHKVTEDESLIRSIQLRVEYWKDGERKASSEKRLALNMLAAE